MEKSSEPSPSASDTEAGSGNSAEAAKEAGTEAGTEVGTEAGTETGTKVATGAEREMILDSDALDASDEDWLDQLTPRQIVAELDKYIVGQDDAKKAVAIALRNRWRRQRVEEELREEILPNNLIGYNASMDQFVFPSGAPLGDQVTTAIFPLTGKAPVAYRQNRYPHARHLKKYSGPPPVLGHGQPGCHVARITVAPNLRYKTAAGQPRPGSPCRGCECRVP